MKKIGLKYILTIVAVLLFATLAAACAGKNRSKPYDYLVTFNYNVGNIVADAGDQYLGVKSGGRIGIKPNEGAFEGKTVIGYYVEGWYLPKTDEQGNPIVGEDKHVLLDRKWDFATDRVSSDITLYANLIRYSRLIIKVDGAEDIVYNGRPDSTESKPNDRRAPKKDGYTFYGYYEDEDLTVPFAWQKGENYVYPHEDKTIYTKFLEGDWSIVSDAQTFLREAKISGKRIYIDKDLDFTGISWGDDTSTVSINGEINGNNHKFIGIKKDFIAARNYQSKCYALFSTISATSKVYDLNIVDAEVTFSIAAVSGQVDAAMFAGEIDSGAEIRNVIVSGSFTFLKKKVDGADLDITEIDIGKFHPISYSYDESVFDDKCKFDIKVINNPLEQSD